MEDGACKELIKLIKRSESETFEKKPSFSDVGRIVEVVASFANSNGGKILIRASDKGMALGIDIGKNTMRRF